MSPFWKRLQRLLHEPRIRLPAPGLSPGALHPGDRLQIGSRLWRVETRQDAELAVAFELTAAEGSPCGARLRVSPGRWSLSSGAGGRSPELALDPASMILFSMQKGE